ncbi:UNVERIFIED_CONTAM: ABC transporter ATP-binding protein [Streptococcus canis]|uniref:ABC transporter ATP-binding protein/permease n=1 Tax=Streptococcus canis TaxID=1329 RepID=UPI000B8AE52F|nr:ABC transporter ATP-binding protein/permease [Streptococcus canis]QJD12292.1 ABC transporter ATP-binding protein [Streptococcus canis]VTR79957.1 ABC transporter ATP-binding protein [Streptococcus canis]GFG47191.1 hypothetical protein ScFU97_05300 [Streptococcus canis]GMX35473.1 hypothetical protein SpKU43_05510 [Streptococcus canis]GMX40652.1 hypothetical protein ScKU71_18750 [Streptococcus canis]
MVCDNGGCLTGACCCYVTLIKPPLFLTLDEVTSSIDIRTAADLILVMEQDWLIEWGTHSALVAKKGFCAKLQKTE